MLIRVSLLLLVASLLLAAAQIEPVNPRDEAATGLALGSTKTQSSKENSASKDSSGSEESKDHDSSESDESKERDVSKTDNSKENDSSSELDESGMKGTSSESEESKGQDDEPVPVNNGPSISATQKPGNPSYMPGPWVYPKPIDKEPTGGPTLKPDKSNKPAPASLGPSIPVTPIPDCPSYVSCPWIYPQPITDPTETTTEGNKPIVEYFGADSSGTSQSGVANEAAGDGPPISATPKPQRPSYVSGPWVYPKPFNEISTEKDTTTTLKPVVEYFGADSSGNSQSTSGNGPSIPVTNKPDRPSYVPDPWVYPKPFNEISTEKDITTTLKPVVEYFGADSSGTSQSSVANEAAGDGPSISATPKPQRPSYVSGPWVYPKPFNEISTEKDTTTTLKPVVEYFGADNSGNAGSGSSQGSNKPAPPSLDPSIPVTPIPDCPPYVSCPWIYPQPITDPTETTTEGNKPIVEYFGADSSGTSQSGVANEAAGDGPPISATPKPQRPSYVSGPWVYPKPFNEISTEKDTTTTLKPVVEYFGADSSGNSQSTSGNGPSIPVTNKPDRPSYVPDPWVYPKPFNGTSKEKDAASSPSAPPPSEEPVVEYFGSGSESHAQEAVSGTLGPSIPVTPKPDCPSYVSCPWIYPKPTTSRTPLSTGQRKSDAEDSNTSTTRHPPEPDAQLGDRIGTHSKKPHPVLSIIHTPWGPIVNEEAEQIADIISQYAIGPAIPVTPKPQYPSYLPGPWVYPKPPGSSSSPLQEYFGAGSLGSTLYKPNNLFVYGYGGAGAHYSSGPSVVVGQKPYQLSYLPNPWIYPLPIIHSKTK